MLGSNCLALCVWPTAAVRQHSPSCTQGFSIPCHSLPTTEVAHRRRCPTHGAWSFFLQAKGVADAGSAAFRVSGLELGGLFGSLLAGRISDALIAKDPQGGNCGKRVQVGRPWFP